MSDPLVSIVIPIYNVEKYLNECIDSVVAQTYINLEIIVINDGSSDDSLQILHSYGSNYENIKVLTQKNQGQSVARNMGISHATGKYIYFLDADDYIHIKTIEKLVEKMERNDLDLIRFSARTFSDDNLHEYNMRSYNFSSYFDKSKVYNNEEFSQINLEAFTASPVLYMTKKEILIQSNLKFKPTIIHEDEIFTLELFLNVDRVMYDPFPYYNRRYRKGSTMTTNTKEHNLKSFESRVIVVEDLLKALKRYNNSSKRELIKARLKANTRSIKWNKSISLKSKRIAFKKIHDWNAIIFYIYYAFSFIKRIVRYINHKINI